MRCGGWALHIAEATQGAGHLAKAEPALKHPKASDAARHIFQQKIAVHKAEKRTIAYIDESGFAHDMPRTHGYSAIGTRCFGTHNWQAKDRVNVIGALIGKLLLTVSLFSANVDADTFYSWTVQDLLPKLPPKSILVMDNATVHKRADILSAITQAGHTIEFLPPYSPDLNPIENKWAHAKKRRRKIQCPIDQLFQIESFYVA